MSEVITHQNLFYVPKICPSATPNLLFSMQIYIQRNFLKNKSFIQIGMASSGINKPKKVLQNLNISNELN